MVFTFTVKHSLLNRLLLVFCKTKVVKVFLVGLKNCQIASRAGSNRAEARVLIEEGLGVVTAGRVKYFEGEVTDRDSPLLNTKKFAHELSEIMLALDQQVSCLFHSYVEFFRLKVLVSSHYNEEFVWYVDVPLQLKLEWHIRFVWCNPCAVQSYPCVPALLAFEGPSVDYSLIQVQRLYPDVGSATINRS